MLWKLFLALCSLAGLAIMCVALFTEHLTLTSWGYVTVGALVIGMILKVGRSL